MREILEAALGVERPQTIGRAHFRATLRFSRYVFAVQLQTEWPIDSRRGQVRRLVAVLNMPRKDL